MKYPISFLFTHIIVLVITVACFMMAFPMRDGLPVEHELVVRLEYIQDHLFIWQLGWISWMLSALGLLLFATFLASHLPASQLRTYGLILVALGIGPDLTAEVIYAFIIPKLYAVNTSLDVLNMLEVLSVHLTGFLGNGLYNLGGLLLNVLLIRSAIVATWISWSGIVAWILGIGLSLSIAAGSFAGAEIFTALSMVLSTAWMLLIAHTLFVKTDVVHSS